MKHCTLALLALAIVSCAPPYSADLNTSAGLAKQMTLLGTLGPVKSPDGDSTTAIRFLPIKPTSATTTLDQLNTASGFLVSESSKREGLAFAYESDNGVQVSNIGASFSLAGANSNYPLYEYDVITSTATQASIIVFYLGDPSTPGNNTYQCFNATVPNGQFQSASSPSTMNALFGSSPVIAAQVFPLSAAPYDRFNFFLVIGTLYGEGVPSFVSPIFNGGSPTTSNVTLSGAAYRVLYYQGPLGAPSYASYLTAGKWVCYQWTAATTSAPTLLTGVTNRIDAVLTNGDLISTQDGTLTIYDLNGSELNSVSLGGMQFCYEAYVGTTPYVFFSLSIGYPHQAWDFRVYAIPTSKLRGLKD